MRRSILHISRCSFFLHYHSSLGFFPSSHLMFLSRPFRHSSCCSKKWKLTSDDPRIKVSFLAIVLPPGPPLRLGESDRELQMVSYLIDL